MYKRRNEIERRFCRLKGYLRIFSRFEKLDALLLGLILFASILNALGWCEHDLIGSITASSRIMPKTSEIITAV